MKNDKTRFYDRDIEVKLYKQKHSNKWYGRFTFNKKQHRFSCKSESLQESKEFCYKVIEEVTGRLSEKGHKDVSVTEHMMTFEELFKKFLKHRKDTGIAQERTLRNYRTWGKNLVRWCGDWVVEIDFKEYDKSLYGMYLEYRNNKGRDERQTFIRRDKSTGELKEYQGRRLPEKLSGTTLNSECVLLHTILIYSKYDLNMLKDWSVPQFKHHKLPQNHSVVCPTREEYMEMTKYFYDHKRYDIYWWMRLMTNMGLRVSESKRLSIDDVDFGEGVVKIFNRKNKSVSDNNLDTFFPITDRIKPILEGVIDHTWSVRDGVGDSVTKRKLFIDPKTGRPMGDFKKSWSNMLDNLGLDKRYTPKTMRKIFITKMVKQSSIPLPIIATLVGHRNTQTLQKHYLHLRPDDLKHGLEDAYQQIEERKRQQIYKILMED